MKIYINGTGNVSPQKTWKSTSFLEEVTNYHSRMIQCIEPEVDPGLDEKYLRRMSRMIRLGWIASRLCLQDAGNPKPGAIITGSGWGSVHDSEKFLLSIYKNKENLLPPTPFIQSTHSAVGAQIAMLLGNSAYNMTYAHGSFSFEHALLDAIITLKNNEYHDILAGGIDEVTENQFTLTNRLNRWRKQPAGNLTLFSDPANGAIAGEGFTFFLLNNSKTPHSYAVLQDILTIFSTDNIETISESVTGFLEKNGIQPPVIDLVFTGLNGDLAGDKFYTEVLGRVFPEGYNHAAWKHLSGEYLTSTAFATWAAANVLKRQFIPGILKISVKKNLPRVRNILIYNHFNTTQHSFILLTHPDE